MFLKKWIDVLKNELMKNNDRLKKTAQTKAFIIMINVIFFLQMDPQSKLLDCK